MTKVTGTGNNAGSSQAPPKRQPFEGGRSRPPSGTEGSPLSLALLPAPQHLRFQMLLRESHHLFVSHLGEKRCVFVETEALQPRGNICGKGPRSQDPRARSPLSWRRPPGKWLPAALQQRFQGDPFGVKQAILLSWPSPPWPARTWGGSDSVPLLLHLPYLSCRCRPPGRSSDRRAAPPSARCPRKPRCSGARGGRAPRRR